MVADIPIFSTVSSRGFRGLVVQREHARLGERQEPGAELQLQSGLARGRGLGQRLHRAPEVSPEREGRDPVRGLRRRLPLRTLTIAADDTDALEPFRALLADEVNVKAVEFTDAGALGVERFEVDLRNVGKRLGKDTPVVVNYAPFPAPPPAAQVDKAHGAKRSGDALPPGLPPWRKKTA